MRHRAFLFHISLFLLLYKFPATLGQTYPTCAQNAIVSVTPARCEFGTSTFEELTNTNACLCSDTTYLNNAANKIAQYCGCEILIQSAIVAVALCGKTGTPMLMEVEQFVAAGGCNSPIPRWTLPPVPGWSSSSYAASSSSSSYAPSSSSSSYAASSSSSSSSSYAAPSSSSSYVPSNYAGWTHRKSTGGDPNDSPTADRLNIALGLGVGIPSILIAILGILCYRRR